MMARWLGAAALAVLALAAAARATPDLFNAMREEIDNPQRSPASVSHFEKLLAEVEERVQAESANALLQWRVTEAQYVHDIDHLNNTAILAEANRTALDARVANETRALEALRADLASLDSRMDVRRVRMAALSKLIMDGDALNVKQEVRFQDRTVFATQTVEAIDNVIDMLGSNSVDEVDGSLRKALNANPGPDVPQYSEAEPTAEQANKTAGSFVEVAAQAKDDLDELRAVLVELHSGMHAYMSDMGVVRVHQGGAWAHQSGLYQEERDRLGAEVSALAATREPNKAEVAAISDRLAGYAIDRVTLNTVAAAARARLAKKVVALQALRAQQASEENERARQMETVDKLEKALAQHDGSEPASVRAAAAEAGRIGSSEEQRLKRVKAILSQKPQNATAAPASRAQLAAKGQGA